MKNANTRARMEYIKAFLMLLEETSFETITVQQIIDQSTYSRSGFYRYFSDKFELAETVVKEEAVSYARILAERMSAFSKENASEYLYQISIAVLNHIWERQTLYRTIIRSKIPGFGLDKFCNLAVDAFRSRSRWSLRENAKDLDMEFYFYCTTHQFIRYICYWERTGFVKSPEEMARQIVSLEKWREPGKVIDNITYTGHY